MVDQTISGGSTHAESQPRILADDQMRNLRDVCDADQCAGVGWPTVLLEKLRRAAGSQRLRDSSDDFTTLARIFASHASEFSSIYGRGRRRNERIIFLRAAKASAE